jgi:hypothetical protein
MDQNASDNVKSCTAVSLLNESERSWLWRSRNF